MHPRTNSDYLHHALELAVRGHGLVEPNPMVGCVIVDNNGIIVGSGYHEKCGEAHAEIIAIDEAGPLVKGATAFVTLEPCNHQGKTGPCSQALIDAGISRVVIGCNDPNPEAEGGATFLQNNGVEVVCEHDDGCTKLVAPFLHRLHTGLPWVICKWAQTADGYIETSEKEDPWISSQASQQLVHEERGCVDAIIVGVGTVVSDNPSLTVRNAIAHRTPIRVVIDPTLRIPLEATMLDGEVPTLIAHGKYANKTGFSSSNFSLFELPMLDDSLDLRPLLVHLVKEYDATNVIAEGGRTLFEHIFKQQLANELWTFTSQRTMGCANLLNMTSLFEHLDCTIVDQQKSGDDLSCRYQVNT